MKQLDLNGKRIIIAKTTHIGDVVISLPLASAIKRQFPQSHIIFLASGPACSLAKLDPSIDEVCDWQAFNQQGEQHAVAQLKMLNADVFLHVNPFHYLAKVAKKAGIAVRVGSLYRWYHWFSCNRLAAISRHHSKYNKRQLDLQFLAPLGIKHAFSYEEIMQLYQFKLCELSTAQLQLIDPKQFKLILHPSLITAKNYQWPIEYYAQLIRELSSERYQIFISGTPNDRNLLQPLLDEFPQAVDLIGKLKLDELMSFMSHCDGLVAGSTGPLHMAAAVGIHALGIYRADKTYIKRWEPVGPKAEVIAQATTCKACPDGDPCSCIRAITPAMIKARVESWG